MTQIPDLSVIQIPSIFVQNITVSNINQMNLDMVGILQLILFSNKSTHLEVFCKNFTPQSTLPRSVSFVSTITFQNYWFWTIRVCISLTLISEKKERNNPNILWGWNVYFCSPLSCKGEFINDFTQYWNQIDPPLHLSH